MFARDEFALDFSADGENTARELLVAHWRTTGHIPPELDHHDVPHATRYLWEWWCELCADRPPSMGWSGIPSTEIESWARQSGRTLAAWEFRAIKAIDRLFLKSKQDQADADHQREKQRRSADPGRGAG